MKLATWMYTIHAIPSRKNLDTTKISKQHGHTCVRQQASSTHMRPSASVIYTQDGDVDVYHPRDPQQEEPTQGFSFRFMCGVQIGSSFRAHDYREALDPKPYAPRGPVPRSVSFLLVKNWFRAQKSVEGLRFRLYGFGLEVRATFPQCARKHKIQNPESKLLNPKLRTPCLGCGNQSRNH